MLFNSQHKLLSTRTHCTRFVSLWELCNFDFRLSVQDAMFNMLLQQGGLFTTATPTHLNAGKNKDTN